MESPGRGMVRFVRAISWTTAAFALSVGAHVVGGGAPPSVGGALLIVLALLSTGLMLTQWQLGRIALTLTLATSQMLLHSILTASSAACGVTGGHHEVVLTCSGGAPAPHHSGIAMLLAHAVATLLLALLLARGEEAIWFLARRLWPRLPQALSPPSLLLQAITPSLVGELVHRTVVLGGVGRRGPPRRPAQITA